MWIAVAAVVVLIAAGTAVAVVVAGGGSGHHVVGPTVPTKPTTAPTVARRPPATIAPPSTIAGLGNGPVVGPVASLPDVASWRSALTSQDVGFFTAEMGIDPAYVQAVSGRWFGLGVDVIGADGSTPATTTISTTVDMTLTGNADAALATAKAGYGRLGFRYSRPANTGNPLTREVTGTINNTTGGKSIDVDINITDEQNGSSIAQFMVSVIEPGNAPPTAPAYADAKAVSLAAGQYNFLEGDVSYLDNQGIRSSSFSSSLLSGITLTWNQMAPAGTDANAAVDNMAAAICAVHSVSCDPSNTASSGGEERNVTIGGNSGGVISAMPAQANNTPDLEIDAILALGPVS